MIKDTHLRIIFIPSLGIALPVISGIISYHLYSAVELVFINLFFILVSFAIWSGSNWMHAKIRALYAPLSNPFSKIATMCLSEALYGASIGSLASFIWMQFSRESFNWNNFLKFIILCMMAVIVFTLIYEILFLSKKEALEELQKLVDELLVKAGLKEMIEKLDSFA